MDDLIAEIETSVSLSFARSFEIASICSTNFEENENNARRIAINILNNWHKLHPSSIELWTDILEAAGFYPYFEKISENLKFKNLSGQIRKEFHHSNNISKYLHDEQFEVLQLLEANKNVIVSAPTSFGKSLLIEEIIASKKYKNIVIIQPTLALLDETRRKLLKYSNDYHLIVRTSQPHYTDKGNIFLFTAERVNEYQEFPTIEFLVIDEFYKLSGNRDDERSSTLNNAFYYLLKKFNPKFYLLGPNIDSISDGFIEKYDAVFFKSKYSLVDSRSIDVYKDHIGKFSTRGLKKIYKEEVLFNLLLELKNDQTIIYCSSPGRVRYLAKKFSDFLNLKQASETANQYPIIEWITEFVSKDWCLLDFLKYDIGIHDGALQKHISTTIIDYFNKGNLKYLFCTSTIIEGVNTSAKNIIYFDSEKGLGRNVDFFDYSNIKGRAGRMMEHYVGRIYNFNPPPADATIEIDIPFFQQNPIRDEVLIQIDPREIREIDTEQYQIIFQIPENEKEVIKKNGVRVKGQKSIIDRLRIDIPREYHLLDWIIPDYRQLEYVLGLAWEFLIIPGETTNPMTKNKLVKMTFDYGISKSIPQLIKSAYNYQRGLVPNIAKSDKELNDKAILETFQVIKHWFEYKVPKWLSVINEIQKFVCLEKGLRPGSYTYYANLIENDFLPPNLSILAEYGVPSSAIRKIEKSIPSDLNQDLVLEYIKRNQLYNSSDLIDYEKIKLKENL